MRARSYNRAGRANKVRVDIISRQPHIRAILAVKDQWELFLIADAQKYKRGQPVRVRLDAVGVDTFAFKLLADEAPHMLVADTSDHRRFQPQPRRAASDIGRRAADVLVERPHIFQPSANLRAVQVNRGPTYGDEVNFCHCPCLKHHFEKCGADKTSLKSPTNHFSSLLGIQVVFGKLR